MKKAYLLALAGAAVLAVGACSSGGGSGSNASSGMAISGTLGTGSVSLTGVRPFSEDEVRMQEGTFSVQDYGVRCVTLASTPTAGEGQCDSSGKFSLSLAGATNVPIGCFVVKGSDVVATLAFQAATTDINGNASRSGSYVAGSGTSGVTLGTVTLDVTKGLAVVPTTQITTTGTTAPPSTTGSFADMTGAWTIHALSSVPAGYRTAGTTGGDDGPQDGQQIYLGYYSALNGSEAHHGLSIWNSASDLTSCNGEGASLPSGWTLNPNSSPNNKLTTAVNVSTTIPSPTTVHVSCYNGQNFANLKTSVCSSATSPNWQSTTLCSAILTDSTIASSNTTWATTSCPAGDSTCTDSNNHWGLTPVKAALLCTLNSIRDSGAACNGDANVDWGTLWSPTNTTIFNGVGYSSGNFTGISADTPAHNDAVTYFNGSVRFQKTPRNRFLFGEFFLNGSAGSLTDHHDYQDSACTTTKDANGGCPSGNMVPCHVSENNKLTVTQTDSTHATVELVQVNVVSPTDSSACSADSRIQEKLQQSKFMFTLSK